MLIPPHQAGGATTFLLKNLVVLLILCTNDMIDVVLVRPRPNGTIIFSPISELFHATHGTRLVDGRMQRIVDGMRGAHSRL